MKDKVAIILLNWNASQVTIECLESLSKIDYPAFHVFLVDNASSEAEYGIIAPYCHGHSNITLLPLAHNYGFAEGNNIGMRCAATEYDPAYYLLLNNDTVVNPDFLSLLVAAGHRYPDTGITVPKIFFYDEPEYLYFAGGYINRFSGMGEHYGWKQKDNGNYDEEKQIAFANGCCMLISNTLYRKIGGLNRNFFANIEDVEYSYRALKENFGIVYVPQSVIRHKEGYASKRNKGQWFRIYLSTRNLILFYKERAHWYSIFLFLPYFSFRWLFYMTGKSLLSGDFKSVQSLWKGLYDGIRNRLSYVELPAEIEFRNL